MNSRAVLGISLAAVFVFAMMANPVFASNDPKKIVSATASAGTITIVADGTVGQVVPKSPNKIAAYVAITDAGVFAITAHFGVDDDATGDHDWHSHGFTLDANSCIATINSVGVASVSGDTITVTGTGANAVTAAFFAFLKINPVDGSICVHQVF